MAATRVRFALAALACAFAGLVLFVLSFYAPDGPFALLLVLLAVALQVVAVVLWNRSLRPDPKGGPWHWLAVTAFLVPVALLFLPLCGLALPIFVFPQTDQSN